LSPMAKARYERGQARLQAAQATDLDLTAAQTELERLLG